MIQIQPNYSERDQYAALANKEGLFFEVLELSLGKRSEEEREKIENWYKSSGKTTSVHGAFVDVNPVSGNPKIREASRQDCEESCRLARRLGAGNVVFHGSCFPFLRGSYMDNWAGLSAEYYTMLAEQYGVNIYIENSMDLDTTPLCELMKRVKDPRVKLCLDIGHANLSRMPVEAWFHDLGEWIGYIHLSDNKGDFDQHCALGDGTMDMERVFSRLAHLRSDIPMTLEVGGLEQIKKSLAALRQLGQAI